MSDSIQNLPVVSSTELQQQDFERLNLKEIGLQPEDFNEVLNARKDLAEINHATVAEYGKNIATKTSTYTDELLNLVKNKDLDVTGQKLNEVVSVAQQLNTSSILNKPKSTGFLAGLLISLKGLNKVLISTLIPPKSKLMH